MNLGKRPAVGIYFIGDIERGGIKCKDFRVFSTYGIAALAVRSLSLKIENFPDLDFNKTLLLSSDSNETIRVSREASIRRKQIEAFLKSEFQQLKDIMEEERIATDDFKLFAKIPTLRKIVSDSISPFLENEDCILYGPYLELKIPISYVVESHDFDTALIEARKRRQKLECIHNEQLISSVERSNFKWKFNEWLVPIRKMFQKEIAEEVWRYQSFSEFDLAMQLLMHLGARKIEKLWNGQNGTPNIDLIHAEIKRLANELDAHFRQSKAILDDEEVRLPFAKMNGFLGNPFGGIEHRPELDLSQKERLIIDGEVKLVLREKHSGKKITFARVHPAISTLYSQAFCNLHYANPGEIAVFGAYLEDDEMPFAYSSYGKISYNYTKEMLFYMGYADGEIIESSRAWNASFAPENTMSALFTYSQERLAEEFPNVRGILTSINPNLGFSASAFRAIHFEIVSLKPTIFSYQLKDGVPYFRSKRDIAKEFGVSIDELVEGKQYVDNQIPFLPTIEMLYLYDKNERKELAGSPIYVVSENDYIYNR